MSLKIGIVGLPNVGKSTLFNALTKKKVDISNYPFCTIEKNVGIVEVPDERLAKLTSFSHSKKTVSAVVEFVDIAGLVKGAAEGEGLGNKFLTHIREVDAIAHVVRIFDDADIIHVANAINPIFDIETIEYELILKDLETIAKRLQSAQTEMRAKKKGAEELVFTLQTLEKKLQSGVLAKNVWQETEGKSREYIRTAADELQLLTAKLIIYIFNVSEKQIQNHWKPDEKLYAKIQSTGWVTISAKIESELSELPPDEKKEFLTELGLPESGLDQLIKTSYATLGLITFFTTGEDETRAWTIPEGSAAPRAGRAIHSDFEQRFIRAEVINYQKLLDSESYAKAREFGLLRTEGREYIVHDGDVIEFKI